jgi:sarcosine oxidase, subunit gamma
MSNVAIQLDHLGVLPRLVLKGSGAANWLGEQSISVPLEISSAIPIGNDAWIARLGAGEFLIEGNADSNLVSRLSAELSPLPKNVFPVPRCDATFVLAGSEAGSVFAQTCAIDFRHAVLQRVIFSRIAGVSCGILPEPSAGGIKYRLWIEPSYAAYLWATLAGIVTELGGVIRPPTIESLQATKPMLSTGR